MNNDGKGSPIFGGPLRGILTQRASPSMGLPCLPMKFLRPWLGLCLLAAQVVQASSVERLAPEHLLIALSERVAASVSGLDSFPRCPVQDACEGKQGIPTFRPADLHAELKRYRSVSDRRPVL